MPEPILESKFTKLLFCVQPIFNTLQPKNTKNRNNRFLKPKKIKSVVKMYLPPETIFTNFATEKIYQNSENVEPKNKCTRISVAFGRFFKPVFLHFSVVKTEIGSSILSEPAGQISRFWV